MGRIVAVANQKGGVAKTTTALNLGVAVSEFDRKVLLVDLDPQGSLSLSCGLEPDALPRSMYNALMRGLDAREIVVHTPHGPDLLPANIDLSLAEMQLVNMVARERRLGGVLAAVRDDYDLVLIDCQPSMGILTLNALVVADEVLIPVACEYLALRGVNVLLQMISKVKGQLNSRLVVRGLVPTMYDRRTRHSREVLAELRTHFSPNIPVLDAVIQRSIRFAEAAASGEPIFSYAKNVPGAEGYRDLARRLVAVWNKESA